MNEKELSEKDKQILIKKAHKLLDNIEDTLKFIVNDIKERRLHMSQRQADQDK